MCGIVGLFLKNSKLQNELGKHLSEMLVKLSDRGPDSAGLALYSGSSDFELKITLRFEDLTCIENVKVALDRELSGRLAFEIRASHVVLKIFESDYDLVLKILSGVDSSTRLMSRGRAIEIFKEVGSPEKFVEDFKIRNVTGTHGIGHTRMATESAVTTMGAHPFSTGADQCLVHNGSLSNHNSVRRKLINEGREFETDNDSEVAASYLSHKMSSGSSFTSALNDSLDDLDGFFTFVVGTREGFGVLRDRIACKPAVLVETDDYVAFGSEYRALTNLPNINLAKVWEPKPAKVYFWEHKHENF